MTVQNKTITDNSKYFVICRRIVICFTKQKERRINMDELSTLRQKLSNLIEEKSLPLTDNSVIQTALQTEYQLELLFKKAHTN